MNHTEKCVTNEMNAMLMQEFTEMEVEEALKQMAPLKAPNLNGMPLSSIKIFGVLLVMMSQKQFCQC